MKSRAIRFVLRALTPLIFFGTSAQADPITPPSSMYATSGRIGDYSNVGLWFYSTVGTLPTSGSFSLGQFQADPLPPDAGLTYHNMPFDITLYVNPPGQSIWSNYSGIDLKGMLNGTRTGTGASDVVATITSIQSEDSSPPLPFPLSDLKVDSPLVLAPSGINGGYTTLMARLETPEPSTLAFFGLAGLGLVGRRMFRRRP